MPKGDSFLRGAAAMLAALSIEPENPAHGEPIADLMLMARELDQFEKSAVAELITTIKEALEKKGVEVVVAE